MNGVVDVHLCGHVHDHTSNAVLTSGGYGMVTIQAGATHMDTPALATETDDGRVANARRGHGYSFASIARESEGSDRAVLRVYPRRWSARQNSFRWDVESIPDDRTYAEFPLLQVRLEPPPKPPYQIGRIDEPVRGELPFKGRFFNDVHYALTYLAQLVSQAERTIKHCTVTSAGKSTGKARSVFDQAFLKRAVEMNTEIAKLQIQVVTTPGDEQRRGRISSLLALGGARYRVRAAPIEVSLPRLLNFIVLDGLEVMAMIHGHDDVYMLASSDVGVVAALGAGRLHEELNSFNNIAICRTQAYLSRVDTT
jgi:hypothetical protein